MATARDKKAWDAHRRQQRSGIFTFGTMPVGGVSVQTRRELIAESKHLIIKPSMRLVWDDETNRMVWR